MGETDWRRNWVLFWRVGPCSVNLYCNFVNGLGCVPSLLFDLRPNYGGGIEDNGDLLQKVPCRHCYTQCPQPCSRPPLTHTSAGDCWASLGQSLVGSLLLSPGSWCTQGFVCVLQESVSPVQCKFWQLYHGVNGDLLLRAYAIPRSTAPRALAPAPVAVHCWHVPSQETPKQFCLSPCGVSLCAQALFVCSEHLSSFRVWL